MSVTTGRIRVPETRPALQPAAVRRDRRAKRALAVADASAALLALSLAASVLGRDHVSLAVILGLPLVVLASKLHGLYDRDELVIRKTTLEDAPALLQLAAVYTLVTYVASDVLIGGQLGRGQAVVLWLALLCLTLLFRRAARTLVGRSSGAERLFVIGDGATAERLDHKLKAFGVRAEVVGRTVVTGRERDGQARELAALLRDLQVERVVVAAEQQHNLATRELLRAVKAMGVRISVVPQLFDVFGSAVVFDELGGMTVLGIRQFGLSRSSRVIKRAFDVVLGSVAVAVLLPVLAGIAAAVKLDTRGPVFFRQERVGRDGRRFRIYKFRSMVADAEARKRDLTHLNEAEGLFKVTDDPRITRVGQVLRRTSLDELPQLLNVLRGEMSLVGPRPLIASEDETITGFDRRRLHLTPGMTGHWQIMGSARIPMREMVKIDYLYVTTWSLFEDFKILARTVPYMLARRGQ